MTLIHRDQHGFLLVLSMIILSFILPTCVLTTRIHQNVNVIKPAEFDPMELLMLSLEPDDDPKSTCKDPQHTKAYAKMIESAVTQNIKVHISSSRSSFKRCEKSFIRLIRNYYRYKSQGLLTVQHKNPWNNPWVRDYGHSIVYNLDTKQYEFVQPYYEHHLNQHHFENFSVTAYAERHVLSLPVRPMLLYLEFGNLITNGQGKCIVSKKVLDQNLAYFMSRGYPVLDEEDYVLEFLVSETLKKDLGCQVTVFLEKLMYERTGHVDMYMFLLGPEDLVYFKYSKDQDPKNAEIMEQNLKLLKQHFKNIHVFEMPTREKNHIFLTYANALQINQELLVPTYVFQKTQEEEEGRLERTLNGLQSLLDTNKFNAKRVVPLGNTRSIIASYGNIHCLSASWNRVNLPKGFMDKTYQYMSGVFQSVLNMFS